MTINLKDCPDLIQAMVHKLDFKPQQIEQQGDTYTLIGRPHEWVGYKDLRYLASVKEVLLIGSKGSGVLYITVSLR